MSKLIEKIVKNRLFAHLSSNSLLNTFQSAYTKNYSTETTLLSINDHLPNAISHQQVSCLCLLDLSAAFDTLDHSILLHRLSYFGLSSLYLQWVASFLSSRTSAVSIPPHLSPSSSLTCGVPQGSVFGPILFNLYITPLSPLTSSSTISHLLYADDTQLFISFTSKNFPSVISDLQSIISLISSWMSSNYLTLNAPKTEFLLIDLPQQTSKIINPSLSLPNAQPISLTCFAKNLGFIFDSTFPFLSRSLPFQVPVTTIYVIFGASVIL